MQSDEIATQVLAAASRGDRLGFAAAAHRLGSVAEAQELVRNSGVVRMVDRIAVVSAPDDTPGLLRAELRAADSADAEGSGRLMHGHFSVFNEWTEIDSHFEGRFKERIHPGAYKKTFQENRSEIKPLFQHGFDPQIGDKPLGTIITLREDDIGAYYEVELLDARYVTDDIEPGLRANLYGASFRFKAIRDEFEKRPGRSDHNPEGIPERTLKEARVYEFGPVTFGAYKSATAAVRSAGALTADEIERVRSLLNNDAPSAGGAETTDHSASNGGAGQGSHPAPERRGDQKPPPITGYPARNRPAPIVPMRSVK